MTRPAVIRYVALGSSMAAGPGIRPRATGAPLLAGRSARNYAHGVAERLGITSVVELVDVTYSGATTANLLQDRQHGAPPQIEALDGSEDLMTVTIGGNDVGYVPLLFAATLPSFVRMLPPISGPVRDLFDRAKRDCALDQLADSLQAVGEALRSRAPKARIMFVDYLTLLPPAGVPAPPLPVEMAVLGRHVAERLAGLTAVAAAATGCEVVSAAEASRDHHAWSADPWTIGAGWPIPRRPQPFHPNAAGMRAVADLIVTKVDA